ncbi:MAG: ATP-binding protein [Betaproteobacteria bacterium]|nr:ATP-binding protein [Betaproteobacteria bacterium]
MNNTVTHANPNDASTGDAVNQQHPWLGLASFTEETRQYFYGREEEVAELARRVQRKLLTVLFGQSGLGKTSILSAGIVPRLRPEGYCPIYVRIDYASDSVPPSEQIKQAILRATLASGTWTQPGTAVEGESLWEFLHHRDDVLRDADGKPIIPLLIFDQFEEIFTLAQADDAGRKRAAVFIEDLADLVENRPPKSLEAKLENDDSIIERFDFSRADYRVLIALREDYLAHLEGVKTTMPSITQNRMRLARMNGQQALAAVIKPGGRLVSQEVAESIVRFVAGGSELPNAEVEPSLLSLICRELNNARIAQGKSEISVDLLAGSNETILAEFYERSLADQPAAVRKVIEDDLLTDSGYRENLAEERVLKAFTAAEARPDAATTLATLVNRRLLRIEERLDVRRVELTHDVLTGVVAASRKARLEREAKEEAERQLESQRERARTTRKALIRARQIAVGCGVLSVIAVAGGLYGYFSAQRAQKAELDALNTRQLSEAARTEAEKLVVFLLDDFYDELAPVGRLEMVGKLAESTIAYYKELPPALRTTDSERNQVLASVRLGAVLENQSKMEEANAVTENAARIVTELRTRGDSSDATLLAHAATLMTQGRILTGKSDWTASVGKYAAALEILKPMVAKPGGPAKATLLQARAFFGLGYAQLRVPSAVAGQNLTDAKQSLTRAMELARELKALDLTNLPATEIYLNAGAFLTNVTYEQGKSEETTKVAKEVTAVADRVLKVRPDFRPAIRASANIAGDLATIDYDHGHVKAALTHFQEQVVAQQKLVALDPSNTSEWNNLAVTKLAVAQAMRDLGRVEESIATMRDVLAMADKFKLSPMTARNFAQWSGELAMAYQNMGDAGQAQWALAQRKRFAAVGRSGGDTDFMLEVNTIALEARLLQIAGKYSEALALAKQGMDKMVPAKANTGRGLRNALQQTMSRALYGTGDFASAEESLRKELAFWKEVKNDNIPTQFYYHDTAARLARTLVRQGKTNEAQELMKPALQFANRKGVELIEDNEQIVGRCNIFLAAAMADPAQRAALLDKGAALFATLPPAIKRWRSFAEIGEEIAREMGKR